ncbi:MAG: hypothetical protein ABSE45_09330 [Candidatus Acidiferrales bacterium]|jgi:hypothetical protein
MVSKCANPDCSATFDHRRGKLFRFPKRSLQGDRPANTHSVQHFWLCGECFEAFFLEYHESHGVTMKPHVEKAPASGSPKVIAAA